MYKVISYEKDGKTVWTVLHQGQDGEWSDCSVDVPCETEQEAHVMLAELKEMAAAIED